MTASTQATKVSIPDFCQGIQYFGEQADPISGKIMKIREVMTQVSDSEMHLEMYSTPIGRKEFMSMQIIMKR